ncbi:MAG: hypothetical protein IKT52_13770 [Oscillospiraceae bacterium]|nr:hypothetical protein [Oscillospiraceae bacterium]
MGYTYRNKKTKEVINTSNKVTGKNWELVEDTDSQMTNGEGFEEDAFEDKIPEDTAGEDFEEEPLEDEIPEDTTGEEEPEQTEVAEEAPVEKPKASHRGKK